MNTAEAALLRSLLEARPTAALATLHRERPAVSMVPFALLPGGEGFVIHVSRLATHTRDMLDHPEVALLITASPESGASPLALPRLSVQGQARPCPADAARHEAARRAYLAKLPEAEPLLAFSDFSFFVVEPESLRFVAGFGQAMAFKADRLRELLSGSP